MPRKPAPLRDNQRLRTRKDLLAAAGRLLKQGKAPDMDAVAQEALVSRATAYRYFPTIESLLVEANLDDAVPMATELFANDTSTDPVTRLDKAEAAMHDMCYRNATQLRLMLAASMQRQVAAPADAKTPVRQNRRAPLIEAALAPAKQRLTDAAYKKLTASLALIFGTESMIVFQDVLGMDEKSARKIKAWTIQALVNAALKESAGR
jgi:AcrR family transcriptional regulator